jgi:hypothetical protein
MALTITSPVVGQDFSQDACRFLFDNLFDTATTVVASSEDPDFPVENVSDWLLTDFFAPAATGTYHITLTMPTTTNADCMAFFRQDLHLNAGSIVLQYWDGAAWQDATSTILPANDKPQIFYFDTISASMWRFEIDSTVIASIGALFVGEHMALEVGVWKGFTPPIFARNNNMITSMSQSGQFIGRSIVSNAGSLSLTAEFQSLGFMRDEWLPFIKHAELKPFFFTWNDDNFPLEDSFAWLDQTNTSASNQTFNRMSATIKMRVLTE